MKISLLTIGTRGDVQPFIALGLGLQETGYQVEIVTHAIFESWIRSYGFNFAVIEGDPQEFIASEEGKKILESGKNPLEFVRLFAESISPFVDSLMTDIWRVCQSTDIIIAHSILFWTYDLAKKLDIPYCLASFTPLTATFDYPVALANKSLGSLFNYLSYPVASFVLWQIFRNPVNQYLKTNLGLSPRSIWRSPLIEIKQNSSILYAYSSSVLPRGKNWSDNIYITGYWFLESKQDWTIPQDLIDFLNNGSPPVYVGFGSMSDRDPLATMEIVLAALAKTNQRGIIATGWGGIDDLNLPSSVFKIDSIPHDWLFPQCAAVVHHGGAGTTAAGMKAGVPSIIVPFFSDQPFWGYRIFDLGVGTEPILRSQLTVNKLTAAINQAIQDGQMQTSAQRVGNQIRSEDGVKKAVTIISSVVNRWITRQDRI
ncbi:glycosyltransferase [Pleurocapsa sp. CCALA 161]|uniref:glycosyltransferase n=1 Tax=Pleurocapsa sp. CCALA 161 TaxID=2107688 RepID=UPI000D07E48D|nr:glycosyltransferase [Pleurocapsa sp. CCALA 161]PSB08826.1 glycosyltransferase [Pleurocapsa sp. CCALA 161]